MSCSKMMKIIAVFGAITEGANQKHTFGPKHCVSVSRKSETGTCVLQTDCGEMNLDEVEFSFTCQNPGIVQKHSFGKGGFDSQETFDTSVKCDVCGLPSEVSKSLKNQEKKFLESKPIALHSQEPTTTDAAVDDTTTTDTAAADSTTTTDSTTTAGDTPAAESTTASETTTDPVYNKVSYGPSNCIETWLVPDKEKSQDKEAGYCYVKTQCQNVDTNVFKNYPMGVIASNHAGAPVRHLFGKDSFNVEEEFNTLIRATGCYGLDETAEAVSMENEIQALSKVIYGVKQQVDKLNGQVGTAQTLLLKEHQQLNQYHKEQQEEKAKVEESIRLSKLSAARRSQQTIVAASPAVVVQQQKNGNEERDAQLKKLEAEDENVPAEFGADE